MFTTANKTTKPAAAVQLKAQQPAFFRKAGEETFFQPKENSAFLVRKIQPKLKVSSPDDPQEKEADAVADKVMRMPAPVIEKPGSTGRENNISKKEEEKLQPNIAPPSIIQRKPMAGLQVQAKAASPPAAQVTGDAVAIIQQPVAATIPGTKHIALHESDIMRESGRGPPAASIPFEQTLNASKGSGSRLPADTQGFMESRFNADFSGVRVHTDATAVQLTTSVNAQAFAHGNDIYFNSGKFSPQSTEGGVLLAHELTHTIQQGASRTHEPTVQKQDLPPNTAGGPTSSLNMPPVHISSAAIEDKQSPQRKQESFEPLQPVTDMYTSLPAAPDHGAPVASSVMMQKELKEETKVADKRQQKVESKEATVQTKKSLSGWNVDAKGALITTPTPPPPVVNEPKPQRKEEDKKEEEDRKVIAKQPVIQKKHEVPLLSRYHADVDKKEVSQPVQAGRVNQDTDRSLNARIGITEAAVISARDRGPPAVVQRAEGGIQRSPVDDALGYAGSILDCPKLDLDEFIACAKGKAQQVALHIPGYKALRVVLGSDPITGESIARNGRNFIEAAFDIVPGGNLLYKKLDEIHKLDAAAQWIDERIETVKALVDGLAAAIRRFWDQLGLTDLTSPMDVLRRGANIVFGFISSVVDFARKTATDLLKMVKDFLLDKIVEFIKKETTAYPLLCVILGKDPITEKPVERNGTTILNALLELGGEEGRNQKKKMDETGTFQKVAAFIDEGIKIFSGAYDEIVAAFKGIWNEVSIESLMDPVGTFRRIYNNFAAPVQKVWDFVKKVGAEILKLVKEVMMKSLSQWAKTVRGYTLVTVIIGEDPFTKEPVPPTVENLIHGFMSLMDGGEEQFKQMKESGAVAKAEQKIKAAVKKLNMTPQMVIQLFIDLWNSFTIADLLDAVGTFKRILAKFGEPISRLIAFVIEIVKIVVEVILIIMQFPFDLINNIMAKAREAFQKIKADPMGFLKNLLRAIKEGFIQFFDNILKHLLAGLTGWLMSELKDANVKAPKDFQLGTIIGWVLELLGITMEKIWEKLAKHPKIGPERVAKIRGMINKLEGIWTFIKDVQERGMAAIWDKIVEKLSDLWNTVLDAIKNWIMQQIIEKMVTKLLSMLDPTGIMAVINSAIALYKAIQSFKKYLLQILQIVNSFVEGLVEIADGNTKKAADFLESNLGRGVPIVIGFLANQVGLSGVGKKVGEMIEKVREMVDKALTWLVNKAVDTAFGVIDKLMGKGKPGEAYPPEKQAKIDAGLKTMHFEHGKYVKNGKISKVDAEKVAATVKTMHPVFTTFVVKDAGKKWDYAYTASAETKEDGAEKAEDDADANVKKLDDGKLSIDDRKKLIEDVTAIVGADIVSKIFASPMTGKPLVTLFNRIKTEAAGKGLAGGFRIKAFPKSKTELEFNYYGLHSNGSTFTLSELKMRPGIANFAEIKGNSLSFDFIVHENVANAGVKGVGSKMFEMGVDHFKGKFDTISALWIADKHLYKKGMSDNLIKFIDEKKKGATDADAAKKTWTYSQAAKKGYDNVISVDVTVGDVDYFKDLGTPMPPYPENIIEVSALFGQSTVTITY